ncbi:hypothetical protein BJI69_03255 [Luteibacter rhizovicinus DSM 16549]|uniref:Uncharacterized protein n=1 Tax=Luteibacter rhizovicinus DSM 16549 TaxID=1440763 RepID=A0A1L3EPN3_9GAMM|nr:hypothetical protein [Luteibacter rhizovicinus]APG03019.1 hypothetical protein BJI69_03255 [Luteibacter rhizovicinus DSM 16549]
MRRYSTKSDDDLHLGATPVLSREDPAQGAPLQEALAVLNERLQHVSVTVRDLAARLTFAEDNRSDILRRLAVIEERLSQTATKAWVLGCAAAVLLAMLTGTLGGVWWMFQQYVGPLLRTSAG